MTATLESPTAGPRLSTAGILRSEWVKLVTLRSTWWCLALIAGMTAGVPVLIALALGSAGGQPDADALDVGSHTWAMANTVIVSFTVLIAAVLGCLVITGEYGTGMIRSSLTAAPGRLSTVFAKAFVIGLVVFVVGALALTAGALASAPILASGGLLVDTGDPRVWLALLGAAGYPALVAVLSVGVGTVVRNSAGAIAAVLGLLLVVPTVLQLVAMLLRVDWMLDVMQFLPSALGNTMASFVADPAAEVTEGPLTLAPWQAALAMAGWAGAALAGGAAAITRRDV